MTENPIIMYEPLVHQHSKKNSLLLILGFTLSSHKQSFFLTPLQIFCFWAKSILSKMQCSQQQYCLIFYT